MQLFNPDHHVQVSLRVLLDNVSHIVWLSGLLEFPSGHEVLDLSDGSDRVPVGFGQITDTETRDQNFDY